MVGHPDYYNQFQTALQQVGAAPAPPDFLSQGMAQPQLNLGSGTLHYLDEDLDRHIVDSSMGVATNHRVDLNLADPEGLATQDQIQRIVDSYKSPFQLVAQGQISPDTAARVLDQQWQQWHHGNLGQRFQMLGHIAQVAGGEFLQTIGQIPGMIGAAGGFARDVAGAMEGPQPVVPQSEEAFQARETALTQQLNNLTDPTGPEAQAIKAQMAENEAAFRAGKAGGAQPPADFEAQQQQIEAEREKGWRTLGSAGEAALQGMRDLMQPSMQVGREVESAINRRWLGLPDPSKMSPTASLFDLYGIQTHAPWDRLNYADKLNVVNGRVGQIQDEGRTLAGDSGAVNNLVNFLSGGQGMTPYALAQRGQEVNPAEVQLGSLAAQVALTHGLGDVPGADALSDTLARGSINTLRLPVWGVDLALKGASAAAKNDMVMGTLGVIPGIINAWHEIQKGNWNPVAVGLPTWGGIKGGVALAKRGIASGFGDLVRSPVEWTNRVLATAVDDVGNGHPFFGLAPEGWKPPWQDEWQNLKDRLNAAGVTTGAGSMAKAGPVTRVLGRTIGQVAKTGATAAELASVTTPTEEPEKAGQLVGQMAALGGMAALPGAVKLGGAGTF
jgi:hypothetical protein